MNRLRAFVTGAILGVGLLVPATTATAAPILQLDILGGRWDESTRTILARENEFTLLVLLTPDPTSGISTEALFNEVFYLSAAVAPQLHTGGDLGSFYLDGPDLTGQVPSTSTSPGGTVDVTSDMVYGSPPVESLSALQPYDDGDLHPHDVYNTYFAEFAFRFNPANETSTWDTHWEHDPNRTTIPTGTGSYYAAFTVNTENLDPLHQIHFDAYASRVRNCAPLGTCTDEDVKLWAPFDRDAQSAPIPEPASLLLLGTGLLVGARAVRRLPSGKKASRS